MILEGRVRVNNQLVSALPAWVDPENDRVTVDGEAIARPRRRRSTGQRVHTYIVLNKPKNVVCTNRDPEGRQRAIDLVELPGHPRLFCVGRLDAESTGLLLLTTDGDLANELTHPSYGVHKTYEVVIRGSLDADAVAALERGIFLADRGSPSTRRKRRDDAARTAPVRLHFMKRDRERTLLRMEMHEGRNRQIRRMMARLDHPVKKLMRVQLGPLRMKGLALGDWRMLTASEVRALKRAADHAPSGQKPGVQSKSNTTSTVRE
jgi:23S rRNA pseudouridine2605 synthase